MKIPSVTLEPLRKGVIAKMATCTEFWLILKRNLVDRALQKIFDDFI
jgi:hypothetical protein